MVYESWKRLDKVDKLKDRYFKKVEVNGASTYKLYRDILDPVEREKSRKLAYDKYKNLNVKMVELCSKTKCDCMGELKQTAKTSRLAYCKCCNNLYKAST